MVDIIKLSNGLRIAIEPIPFVRSVSFGILVGNGARHENISCNGISHFIEHMLFKGTENRTAKEIADQVDCIGGQINAYTSKEYTCYYTKTLDTHFDTALDILSDMFFHSKFDDAEIQKERNVIVEEINMYEDTPEELVHDLLQLSSWKNNSLGLPILGTEEIISKFNHETFKQYYKKNYRPDNTVIAVAGNVNEKDTIKKIEKYFGSWTYNEKVTESKDIASYTPSFIKREKDIEQVHLCLSFPGVPLGSKDTYVIAALNTIFGGGMSSRLFQRIREDNGLAYSVYSYASSYKDTGIFAIYAGMSENQTQQVIELILDEIKQLFKNKITSEQLYKTKEQLKSNYILGLESTSNRMSSIGRGLLLLNRIQTPDELIQKIDDITLDKLAEMTEVIFDLSKVGVCAVGKVKNFDFERLLGINE